MLRRGVLYATGLMVVLLATTVTAQDRETKVRLDQQKFIVNRDWIYNDLERGFAEAKRTGKPLLVVFRCIP